MNINGPSFGSKPEHGHHTSSDTVTTGMCPAIDSNYGRFYIGRSDKKGRGLFATRDLPPFSIIHTAPCIVVRKEEYESHAKHTIFEHYLFNDTRTGDKLLALGYGSLFNHDSRRPNVMYRIIHSSSDQTTTTTTTTMIEYKSGAQRIPKDTELCISYGSNLWFNDEDEDDAAGTKPGTDDSSDDEAAFLHRMEC